MCRQTTMATKDCFVLTKFGNFVYKCNVTTTKSLQLFKTPETIFGDKKFRSHNINKSLMSAVSKLIGPHSSVMLGQCGNILCHCKKAS